MTGRETRQQLLLTGFVVAAVAAFIGLFLTILSLSAPETVNMFGVGSAELLATVSAQTGAVERLTGFKPLFDSFLLVGSYIFVSLLLWLQKEIRTYLANRYHFE